MSLKVWYSLRLCLKNSTNLKSYPFPVKLVYVEGANVETVITHPSQELLANMIRISKISR